MRKLEKSQNFLFSKHVLRTIMNMFNESNEKKYCESCRETLYTHSEYWEIELKPPGSGGLGILRKTQRYILCKKCFMNNANILENNIIQFKKTNRS